MAGGVSFGGWLGMAALWQAMMTAMMAPTAYPWLRAAGRIGGGGRGAPAVAFGAGYFVAWLPFSLALAAAQMGLATRLASPDWRGGLLLVAGLYQFAPLKRACLRHCRNPLGSLLERWAGPQPLWRLGAKHGLVCLGCCWALMATALALGMANLAWMAALAAATFAEQTLPKTAWVRPVLGAGLVVAGGALLLF
ncbi:MAG TPA: DUF2182 domain-containing protein [Terriglobales bacterium]|nr:DUF2182 domain-containing protein [Terriglobales bacterium]